MVDLSRSLNGFDGADLGVCLGETVPAGFFDVLEQAALLTDGRAPLGSVELLTESEVLAPTHAADLPADFWPFAVDDNWDVIGWLRKRKLSWVGEAPLVLRWSRATCGYVSLVGLHTLDALLRLAGAVEATCRARGWRPAKVLADSDHAYHADMGTVHAIVQHYQDRAGTGLTGGNGNGKTGGSRRRRQRAAVDRQAQLANADSNADADTGDRPAASVGGTACPRLRTWPARPCVKPGHEWVEFPIPATALRVGFEPPALTASALSGPLPERLLRHRMRVRDRDDDAAQPLELKHDVVAEAWHLIHLPPTLAEESTDEAWSTARELLLEIENHLPTSCRDWPYWRAAREADALESAHGWLAAAERLARREPLAADACLDAALVEGFDPDVLARVRNERLTLARGQGWECTLRLLEADALDASSVRPLHRIGAGATEDDGEVPDSPESLQATRTLARDLSAE